MKYFIDSTDINEIKKWIGLLGPSFAGVTTNKGMLPDTESVRDFLVDIISMVDVPIEVFIQVINREVADMVIEKNRYSDIDFVLKFPIVEEFMLDIQYYKSKVKTCATSMFNLIQFSQMTEYEMDYSMVYYNKNPDKDFIFQVPNGATKRVGASMRNKDDVIVAIMAGLDYVTVKPSVLTEIFNCEESIKELK